MFIGIDPGTKGGMAVIRPEQNIELYRFPLDKTKVNFPKLAALIRDIVQPGDVPFIALELTMGRGGWGAAANHSLGYNNGFLHGIINTMGWAYELVNPKAWQKLVWSPSDVVKKSDKNGKQIPDPKGTSKRAAKRIFPQADFQPGKLSTDHDGLMDAALLAYYSYLRAIK